MEETRLNLNPLQTLYWKASGILDSAEESLDRLCQEIVIRIDALLLDPKSYNCVGLEDKIERGVKLTKEIVRFSYHEKARWHYKLDAYNTFLRPLVESAGYEDIPNQLAFLLGREPFFHMSSHAKRELNGLLTLGEELFAFLSHDSLHKTWITNKATLPERYSIDCLKRKSQPKGVTPQQWEDFVSSTHAA